MTQATSRALAQGPQAGYRARAGSEPAGRWLDDAPPRSWLRVVAPSRRARRAPFVVLLGTVVVAGVLGLVSLSIAVNQQAFALAELERSTHDLTVRHSTLRAEVDRLRAPDRIERIATERGLQPVQSARIAAWPGSPGGQAGKAGAGGGSATAPAASAADPSSSCRAEATCGSGGRVGRLWTVDDPHPLKHYLAQP